MKVLVVSDTHGHDENLMRAVQREWPFDALVHCGDLEGSEEYLRESLDCACFFVKGNNDFFSDLPKDDVFCLENYRIMVTHGHMYGVSFSTSQLEEEARCKNVQVVMFGHTHYPYLDEQEDLTVLNPGSLSYPRQPGRKPGYLVMEIDAKGKAHYQQKYLEN